MLLDKAEQEWADSIARLYENWQKGFLGIGLITRFFLEKGLD